MLVFFLAALSGVIALTMATSNAGRYTHEKEDQQEYLSVVSASKLILSTLSGVKIHFQSKFDESPDSVDDLTVSILDLVDSTVKEKKMFFKDQKFID